MVERLALRVIGANAFFAPMIFAHAFTQRAQNQCALPPFGATP
jgi:hypothetical protein